MRMMTLLIASLLLLPFTANADDSRPCEATQPRNLQLDLDGIDTIIFDIGASELDVRATADATGKVTGRACASDAKRLAQLTIGQQKSGRTLTVHAMRKDGNGSGLSINMSILGKRFARYAYLTLEASVPDTVMVQLKVGSGEARLDGARAASADIGSGDANVTRIRGRFTAKVGSGDLVANDVGALEIVSVGSGDAFVRQVHGASKVGSIGSGDLAITATRGPVAIDSVGSGDVRLEDIGGDVTIGSIGSGDLDANTVHGSLNVRSIGSGDIDHREVSGRIQLPSKH